MTEHTPPGPPGDRVAARCIPLTRAPGGRTCDGEQRAAPHPRGRALRAGDVRPRDGAPVRGHHRGVLAPGRRVRSGAGIRARRTPLTGGELERRRAESGLGDFVPRLTQTLASVIDAGQMVVVADAEGRVLWRAGSSGVRRMADGLGFVGGSAWTEGNVGTNAIGTSLVLGEGVHIQGPEHFVESHTRWGCAAAPLRDPWSGRVLGVVDVSGPSRGHAPGRARPGRDGGPADLDGARRAPSHRARPAPGQGRSAARRARAATPSRSTRDGHLAAAVGSRAPRPGRPARRPRRRAGVAAHPGRGDGRAARRRLAAAAGRRRRIAATNGCVLDLSGTPCVRRQRCRAAPGRASSPPGTPRSCSPSSRPGPTGRTATALADDLFDDAARVVTVRAEMSRLRRAIGSVLLSGPYRLAPGPCSPRSTCPATSTPRCRAPARPSYAGCAPAARPAMSPAPRSGLHP